MYTQINRQFPIKNGSSLFIPKSTVGMSGRKFHPTCHRFTVSHLRFFMALLLTGGRLTQDTQLLVGRFKRTEDGASNRDPEEKGS